jgi:CheY-like chemotaxis protein
MALGQEVESLMFQILVVEDDRNIARLMLAVLKHAGYEVFHAEGGIEALEFMDTQHIDLIVLDIMMPGMDGYEFTEQLRGGRYTTPILMVTAKQMPEDVC